MNKVLFTVTLLAATALTAEAQTAIAWANSGTDFATGANWTGAAAPANSTGTNTASFGTGTVVNPVLASARSIAGFVFSAGASSSMAPVWPAQIW